MCRLGSSFLVDQQLPSAACSAQKNGDAVHSPRTECRCPRREGAECRFVASPAPRPPSTVSCRALPAHVSRDLAAKCRNGPLFKKIRLWSKTDAIARRCATSACSKRAIASRGRTWRSRSTFWERRRPRRSRRSGCRRQPGHAFNSASGPRRRRGIGASWRTVAGGASRDDDHVTVDVAKLWPRTVLGAVRCEPSVHGARRALPSRRGGASRFRDDGRRRAPFVRFHAPRRQPRHTWGSP